MFLFCFQSERYDEQILTPKKTVQPAKESVKSLLLERETKPTIAKTDENT